MIKAEITTNEAPTKPYPKLRSSGEHVVLFTDPTEGTTVHPYGMYRIGYHSKCWDTECFKDFNGGVTLSND